MDMETIENKLVGFGLSFWQIVLRSMSLTPKTGPQAKVYDGANCHAVEGQLKGRESAAAHGIQQFPRVARRRKKEALEGNYAAKHCAASFHLRHAE